MPAGPMRSLAGAAAGACGVRGTAHHLANLATAPSRGDRWEAACSTSRPSSATVLLSASLVVVTWGPIIIKFTSCWWYTQMHVHLVQMVV